MEIEVLGSGGAIPTPRPGCACRLCRAARDEGIPHARCGPCVYVRGPDLLVDTPEEARLLLERAGLGRVAACAYSHWHPDHTAGWRVWETVGGDFRGHPPAHHATRVLLPEGVAQDFESRLGLAEAFRYLERRGLVRLEVIRDGASTTLGAVRLTPLPLAEPGVYAFLLTSPTHRVLVAMDETKDWSPPAEVRALDLDVAVLPTGVFEHDPRTGARRLDEAHPLLDREATWEETLALARTLGARRTVFHHIEEADGNTPDELEHLAARLKEGGLEAVFAWDGQRVASSRGETS